MLEGQLLAGSLPCRAKPVAYCGISQFKHEPDLMVVLYPGLLQPSMGQQHCDVRSATQGKLNSRAYVYSATGQHQLTDSLILLSGGVVTATPT